MTNPSKYLSHQSSVVQSRGHERFSPRGQSFCESCADSGDSGRIMTDYWGMMRVGGKNRLAIWLNSRWVGVGVFLFLCLTAAPSWAQTPVGLGLSEPVLFLEQFVVEQFGECSVLPLNDPADPEMKWSLVTGADGQMRLVLADGLEVRLKEQARLDFSRPGLWRYHQGIVGFNTGKREGDLTIHLPIHSLRKAHGIFVLKRHSSMIRVAMLKGNLELMGRDDIGRWLVSNQELAMTVSEVSESYKPLEDLFYAWYWNRTPTASVPSALVEKAASFPR